MMRRIPLPLLVTAGVLMAAAVISTAWRLADGRQHVTAGSAESPGLRPTAGPVDAAFCGPPAQPLPPPPIDSPFGYHLYAGAPADNVRPLAAMEAASRLVRESAVPRTQEEHAVSEEEAREDVQTVVLLLEEYRRVFGAMPLGELNEEIVRRLQGENPKGIAVLPRDHPSLSPAGELLDRWGTPYRFHPESAWLTTVRSAGPDREMWTADDLVSEETQPEETDALTAGF